MKRSATLARHGTRLTPLGPVYAVGAVALSLTLGVSQLLPAAADPKGVLGHPRPHQTRDEVGIDVIGSGAVFWAGGTLDAQPACEQPRFGDVLKVATKVATLPNASYHSSRS